MKNISIIGSGTMGIGIAQIASDYNHKVVIYDKSKKSLKIAKEKLEKILNRLIEKQKIDKKGSKRILTNIKFSDSIKEIEKAEIVIEAIVEDLAMKKDVFQEIENLVSENCIIATNTSSISITSIASACKTPERVIGMHFFNPAPLMPLVEIIPAIQTSNDTIKKTMTLSESWKKTTVLCKDIPGFIVNRLARSFYSESIRIYEENIANKETIDWAMKELGGFRMGPFELMDYIGNDVNYKVTETIFNEFYFDQRYKPSITQKRLVEAGYFGRKSGRGYYNYLVNENLKINQNRELGKKIVWRVLCMLVNEAIDALYLKIASKEDIDKAMKNGVNYPKGLLEWGDEIGHRVILEEIIKLRETYSEDRYRPSPLLIYLSKNEKKIFENAEK
tara:strand:- start:10792 stop:11961 length:1170 start_codon:yes stop_codon:yes gene_type:complete